MPFGWGGVIFLARARRPARRGGIHTAGEGLLVQTGALLLAPGISLLLFGHVTSHGFTGTPAR